MTKKKGLPISGQSLNFKEQSMLRYADMQFYWLTGIMVGFEYVHDDGEGNRAIVVDLLFVRCILTW